MMASTSYGEHSDDRGIVSGHAYTVLSVHDEEGYKLIRIRNPWGNTEW